MRSPFPGMDPYLERHWEDVHLSLIVSTIDALHSQLSEDVVARATEKSQLEKETAANGDDPIRRRSVLIRDTESARLITVIEFLSPWDKFPEAACAVYLDKRESLIKSGINLVEIDLVRTGDWTQMLQNHAVPEKFRTPYRVTSVPAGSRRLELYPVSLRTPLPAIRIPLRPAERPACLELQELVEKVYINGRYNRIDYTRPCVPPLQGPDGEWADELLRGAGKR